MQETLARIERKIDSIYGSTVGIGGIDKEKNRIKNKNLPTYEQIKAAVDDELYIMKKNIQFYYKLSEDEARDLTNKAVRELMEFEGNFIYIISK